MSDECRAERVEKNMKRKITVLAFYAMLFALCASVDAQQAGKVSRIGILDPSTASGSAVLWESFRQELHKLGWIAGKNIIIHSRFADQKGERLPELAAELLGLKVDLIVVPDTPSTLAVKNGTATIPIVMTNPADPVSAGLVASLARPGGNVTGLSSLSPELNTKRLEILKDAVPKLARVGLLRTRSRPTGAPNQINVLRAAAPELKLKLEEIEIQFDSKSLDSAPFKLRNRSRWARL
jgi:putative tryptophan/tyrosine transport system substrate-binding protein